MIRKILILAVLFIVGVLLAEYTAEDYGNAVVLTQDGTLKTNGERIQILSEPVTNGHAGVGDNAAFCIAPGGLLRIDTPFSGKKYAFETMLKVASGEDVIMLGSWCNNEGQSIFMYLRADEDGSHYSFLMDVLTLKGRVRIGDSLPLIPVNEWVHLALLMAPGGVDGFEVYINGNMVLSRTITDPLQFDIEQLRLGGGDGTFYFEKLNVFDNKLPTDWQTDVQMALNLPLLTDAEVRCPGEAVLKDTSQTKLTDVVESLFDKDPVSCWVTNAKAGMNVVDIELARPLKLENYVITAAPDSPECDPIGWALYASNDGKDYQLIERKIMFEPFSVRGLRCDFTAKTQEKYKYYRFHFDVPAKGTLKLAELELANVYMPNAADILVRNRLLADNKALERFNEWKATRPAAEQRWLDKLAAGLGDYYYREYMLAAPDDPQAWNWGYVADIPNLPRILLIGDAISRAYTGVVRSELASQVNVHRAPADCGSAFAAAFTAPENLQIWLDDDGKKGNWDLIVFNFGIHDRLVEVADYQAALEKIIAELSAQGKKLVFATTTPLPEKSPYGAAEKMVELNAAAKEVMAKHNIEVLDLYSIIAPYQAETQVKNDCHFMQKGSEILGKAVADKVRQSLQL